jgi:hypothetical protein
LTYHVPVLALVLRKHGVEFSKFIKEYGMLRFLSLMVAVVVSTSNCYAGFLFTVDAPSSYSAGQAGTQVTQNVYLSATPNDTLQSLAATNFEMVFSGSTSGVSFSRNLAFDGVSSGVATIANGFRVTLSASGFPGVAAVSNQVLLGSVTMNLGTAGSSTVIDFNPATQGSNILGNFNNGGLAVLDTAAPAVFDSQASINITAVPEPSTMALIGLAGVGFVAFRRMRKSKVA